MIGTKIMTNLMSKGHHRVSLGGFNIVVEEGDKGSIVPEIKERSLGDSCICAQLQTCHHKPCFSKQGPEYPEGNHGG